MSDYTHIVCSYQSLLIGPLDGPCLNMTYPCIAITGQSSLMWLNLEQLAHGDAS